MVKPKFTIDFLEAVERDGADELTVATEKKKVCCGPSSTLRMWESRWRRLLVDEDWHAVCQAIYKVVEGPEWEVMC